ncbi:unnamed protein product, partial [Prunus brigantina]
MSRNPTILPLIADSKKHVINPADPTTRTHAFIATTKDSTFHTSSQKFAWIINSGKTIGCGTRRGKFYYLDWAPDNKVKVGQAFRISGTRSEGESDKIQLWHKRLGHALFGYLKKLFPSLFSSLDVSSFQCDTCGLAKSHCVLFPLSSNKCLVPFSLVHSDVWGLAKIATLAGEQWFVTFIDNCTRILGFPFSKIKGKSVPGFNSFIKWWRLNFMPEFRFFVLTMAENFSTMIFISSYNIMASYINAHALTLP